MNAEAYSYIASADVLAYAGTGATAGLIHWRTGSPYSHVGLAIWLNDPVRRLAVMDALPGRGVRLVPIEAWLAWPGQVDHYRHRQVSVPSRDGMVKKAFDSWMFAYASGLQFVRSFGWASRRLLSLFGSPIDTDPRAVHCSEFVASCMVAGGLEIPHPPPEMTPGDVVRMLDLHGKVVLDG